MSPASQGADLSQVGRTVALLRSHASFGDLVALMKPRVMSLVVFTALVGLLVAPGHLDPLIGFVALLCITAGAGAAGVLNMWYDADIDAVMTRTAMRPIPRGRVSRAEALAFGLMLAAGSIAVLGFAVNIAAAALLAFTIFFYVVVYTMWLKRRTPQNIVIGGAAGAFPPVIGWVAANGGIGLEPLILFLIIFLWTPPTSGRCRSIVLANTPVPASQCCRSWLARPKQNGRFSFTASCWCRFRSCPGHSDLREQSTARPRGCPVRRSFCLQSSCTGAMAPKSAPLPACSRFRFFTCSCSSPRY